MKYSKNKNIGNLQLNVLNFPKYTSLKNNILKRFCMIQHFMMYLLKK